MSTSASVDQSMRKHTNDYTLNIEAEIRQSIRLVDVIGKLPDRRD